MKKKLKSYVRKSAIHRRLSALLLCVAMLMGLLPTGVLAAANVAYIDGSGITQTRTNATDVTSSTTTWNTGWYVVSSNVTISDRITVTGEVHLILANSTTLTARAGITVSQGNSLTIYAQSTGDSKGELIAGVSGTIAEYHAGIGGIWSVENRTSPGTSGTITINGGTVTAQGGNQGAGIGGGYYGAGGTITISGGTVEATGGSSSTNEQGGAGIGSGYYGAGGTITISGGSVTATGGGNSAGIGAGSAGAGGTVEIMGGAVTATGNGFGAGIGGAPSSTGGSHGSCSISGDAVVFANADSGRSPIGNTSGSGNWNGIVFQGNSGRVYGDVTLEDDFTIPSGKTLTVPSDSTLTVSEGVTVTGSITNNGTINNSGKVTGGISGGTVKVPATVKVTAIPATATYGSSVTLTATVTEATDGSVTFYRGTADNGTSLGSANVSSNGTATRNNVQINSTNGFAISSNTITAVYTPGTGSTTLLTGTGISSLTVSKGSQSVAPGAPSGASSMLTNSITLNTVTGSGQGVVQYGYTTGTETTPTNWQSGTTFDNLSAGTDYTFYTRYAGNDYYEVSKVSSGYIVTTLPDITTDSLEKGTVGKDYSQTLQATVANGKTVTWSLAEGSTLPAGLTLNSDGTITGKPIAIVANHTFTAQAIISGGADGNEQISNTKELSIDVGIGTLATPTDFAWSGTNTNTAVWNPVTDATGYSVQLYRDGEKVGSSVNVTSGTSHDFSSAIDSAGSYTFTVTATTTDSKNYNNSTESSQSTALNYYAITVNDGANGSATATDGNGRPITFALSGTEITLMPSPDASYHLHGWMVNSDGVMVNNNIFTVGSEDVSITPVFEACYSQKDENKASYFQQAVCDFCGKSYGSVLIDETLPEGTITFGTNSWKSFLNTITFGLFFKDNQTVEITATDDSYLNAGYTEDKAVKIEYYLYTSESALTKSDLEKITFTMYTGKFSIKPTSRYVIYVKLTDHADNVTYISSDGIVLDGKAPTKPTVNTNGYTSNQWTNSDVEFTISNSTALSGIEKYQYSTDDGASWTDLTIAEGSASLKISAASIYENGTIYIFRAVSNSGVEGIESDAVTVKIDKTEPSIEVSGETTKYLQKDTVTIEATAGVSSIVKVTVSKDNGAAEDITESYQSGYKVKENGTYTFSVTNGAGLTDTDTITYTNIDTATPIVVLTAKAGGEAYTDGAWTNADVTLSVSNGNENNLGETKLEYKIGENGSWQTNSAPITISEDTNGTKYTFRATSASGVQSIESSDVVVKIDKTEPSIEVSGETTKYLQKDTVTIDAVAGVSGIAKVMVSKDNGAAEDITESYQSGYEVKENGTYTFTVTNGMGVTDTGHITYERLDRKTPVVVINSNGYTDGTWTKEDITLSVSNSTANLGTAIFEYKVDDGEWQKYMDALTVDQDTNGTKYTFRATSASGVESDEVSITVKLDKTAPDGDIKLKENSVKKFINEVTFGLFFKENVDVAITSEDTGSGVQSTCYYRSENILTEEQVAALTDADWTAYTGTISVKAVDAEKFIYYVKIIDNMGNEYCFASNGATFDLTDPVISGVTDEVTYYTTQKVQVTDDNLDTVTLNSETSGSEITLDGNISTKYTIIATDKAGNQKAVTVTMKTTESLSEALGGIKTDNVTSGNQETVEDYLKDLNTRLEDENLTDEEKEIIKGLVDDAQDLLDKIDEAAQAGSSESVKAVRNITPDNVTLADKDALEAAKEDIEKALADYGSNYTEDEKAQLEETLEQIEGALAVIRLVEDVEDAIDRLPESVSPDDIEAAEQINAAKEQYDALSEYEKTLVYDEAAARLESLLEQLGDYRIIEGDESTWMKENAEGLTIIANGAYSKFTGIEIDGNAVSSENYTVSSGSTVITLKSDYLNTLAAGEHTITVLYTDGEAAVTFTISEKTADTTEKDTTSPATGYNRNIILWVALLFVSGAGVTGITIFNKKRRNINVK